MIVGPWKSQQKKRIIVKVGDWKRTPHKFHTWKLLIMAIAKGLSELIRHAGEPGMWQNCESM